MATLTKRQRLELLVTESVSARSSFDEHWQDLGEHVYPRSLRFTPSDTNRGGKRSTKIFDSTATYCADILVAGLMSGASSQAKPWFRLSTPNRELNDVPDVKEWLYDVTMDLQQVFAQSNYYDTLASFYADFGTFGTGAFSIEEDFETVIRCQHFPIGSFYLANDARLGVSVFIRKYQRTVRQIVEEFGTRNGGEGEDWSRFSLAVKSAWEQGRHGTMIDLTHIIAPNDAYAPESPFAADYQFTSCTYETGSGNRPTSQTAGTDQFLEETGYQEFPVIVGRWKVSGEDVYGTNCPGMTALGDIRQLQHGEKRAGQALDKLVNPPMQAPPSARTVKISALPGDVSYVGGAEPNSGVRPLYEMRPDLDKLEVKQEQKRQLIKQAYHTNMFLALLQTDPIQRTATEIQELASEKMTVLGPLMGRLDHDVFSKSIDRVFQIRVRQGQVPPPPDALQGQRLKIEYLSEAAQAQKMMGLRGTERFTGYVMQIAEANPGVLDKVNFDEAVEAVAEMTGVPPSLVVSDEEVAQVRQARAEQQQVMQQAQTLKDAAAGAKSLATSPLDSNNALTALLTAGPPGATP